MRFSRWQNEAGADATAKADAGQAASSHNMICDAGGVPKCTADEIKMIHCRGFSIDVADTGTSSVTLPPPCLLKGHPMKTRSNVLAAAVLCFLVTARAGFCADRGAVEPAPADLPAVQRITLAQIRVGRDVDDNLPRIRAAFAQAKKDKAEWIMFPEGALSGYHINFDQAKVAAALTEIKSLCRDARLIAVLGTCWKENGQTTNEIRIIDADGKLVGRYAKRCLTYGDAKLFKHAFALRPQKAHCE